MSKLNTKLIIHYTLIEENVLVSGPPDNSFNGQAVLRQLFLSPRQ